MKKLFMFFVVVLFFSGANAIYAQKKSNVLFSVLDSITISNNPEHTAIVNSKVVPWYDIDKGGFVSYFTGKEKVIEGTYEFYNFKITKKKTMMFWMNGLKITKDEIEIIEKEILQATKKG